MWRDTSFFCFSVFFSFCCFLFGCFFFWFEQNKYWLSVHKKGYPRNALHVLKWISMVFIRPKQSKELNKTYFFWLSLQLLLLSALLFVDMNHLSLFRISIRWRNRIPPGTLLRNHHSGYKCRLLHAMFSVLHEGQDYCQYWLQLNKMRRKISAVMWSPILCSDSMSKPNFLGTKCYGRIRQNFSFYMLN